jgi:hypothetical protein
MNISLKFILVCTYLCLRILSTAQITDNFSDGDFNNNPTWTGDDTVFTIASVSGNNMLRSNKQIASTSFYLSTSSTFISDCQWEFYVNLQFNTSSANYVDIYLTSDNANLLTTSFNGYFVRIGNTQDEISLYRRNGTVNTKIIDGADGVTNLSNNILKIKVIRNAANDWSLERDITGTGSNYFLEGTVNDANILSGGYFGFLITQSTSSFFQKHFFDDFYIGPIIYDLTPPVIVSLNPVSTTQLDVLFDENVDLTTSQNVANYSVNNGIGNPLTAVRDAINFKLVHLTFSNAFVNAQNYTLTINNVQDLSANAVNNAQANFTFYLISAPSWRDVIINEIMADPSPVVALPDKEFIELYNPSNLNFNLLNWTFSDGTSTGTINTNFILQAGQYVILCASADVSQFTAFGNVIGLSTWPSLNNSSDNLSLRDDANNQIDVVNYSDTWYRDNAKKNGGWTLELINPLNPCSGANNWIASNATAGGTPGTQNSVYDTTPDTQAPLLNSVSVVSTNQLQLLFNEPMDSLSLVNAVYTLSGGLSVNVIQPVGPDFTLVNLFIGPPINPQNAYTITVSGAQDCIGNTMTQTTLPFAIGVPAQKFEVVINEIMANSSGVTNLPDYEYVELYNNTNKVLNLNGYKWSDASSTTTINNAVIYPYSYLILCPASALQQFTSFGNVIGLSSWPSLNNSSDTITLRKANGEMIHQMAYADSWYADEVKKAGGWSLEMIDPNNPCGEANNWRACVDQNQGTPGIQNSIFSSNPDLIPPQIINVIPQNANTVWVIFNESIDSLSIFTATFSINNNINISSLTFINYKTVQLNLSNNLQYNTIYTLSVNGTNDCVGNTTNMQTYNFALPEQGLPGDLIINEVLFNPRTGGYDFVEIYNNSTRIISLQNWKLANYSNGTIANKKNITTEGFILYPKEYLVLTQNKNNIIAEYPLSAQDRFLELSSLPSYNNTSGRVILLNNLDQVSDDFEYDEKMHFALLQNVKGVSLERIDFNRPTTDRTNWHSAAEAVGFATPGYQNSQYYQASVESNVNTDPPIFSPDNDGYQDVVNITYNFAEPGYVANITIYDASGRLVKQLARNLLLGSRGVISWDGINDKNEKVAVGAYLIFFEVFNLQGDVQRFKKTVVVASRLD